MDVTIMNPGVIAPSHMPMMKRQANRAPKEWHAEWAHNATAQMKIFTLQDER
jgi:hypothetical protein